MGKCWKKLGERVATVQLIQPRLFLCYICYHLIGRLRDLVNLVIDHQIP